MFDAEKALRQELWLNHGHPFAALYGDDGEMSCGMVPCFDFKRMPIEELYREVQNVRTKNAVEKLQLVEKTAPILHREWCRRCGLVVATRGDICEKCR